MVASEGVPFVSTGGLGEVVGGLGPALGRRGHQVTLVLPRYASATADGAAAGEFTLDFGRRRVHVGCIEQILAPGVRAVLLDAPDLFGRSGIYGSGTEDYTDNPFRFAVLARGALEVAARSAEPPAIVHAHEWQSGLTAVYLKTHYAGHPVLAGVPVVFTIHNMAFQGLFPAMWLPDLDLDPHQMLHADGLEYWGRISFLKAGIRFSEALTTVSRRYAREILTPEQGFGFEGILAQRKESLTGIPNGIGNEHWNPATDPYLPEVFSAGDLAGKMAAKRELLESFRLPAEGDALDRPVVGMISRLADQKGFDLLAQLAGDLPDLGATFVLLGSGEPRYEEGWADLAARCPDRVAFRTESDERLAHLVIGGADIFLMPSRYEPGGVNQLYSLQYGTVPVVHATGSLDDAVNNLSPRSKRGNGFKFDRYEADALLGCLRRALDVYRDRKLWRSVQLAGMRQDFSWDGPAAEYVKVYRKALKAPRIRLAGPTGRS
jgi:starch synthase